MQHIYKLDGMHRPKGDDDDEEEQRKITRANTRANSASNVAIASAELEEEYEEEEDDSVVGSTDTGTNTETDTTDSDSVSTGNNDDDNEDDDFADIIGFEEAAAVETPAMLAKKMATAASTVANSDAKKKATIANKRAIASSKPPKSKATLQDIATLQNSYDDIEHADGGGDSDGSENDDDDSDDDGNNYLRKFETDMHENYIASCHQEMLHLNNAEVSALARVVRNADGAIVDVMHKTMPFLTKYEKTRILGQRAKQLNQGAQSLIPVDKKIIDGYLIAQLELQQKALPFIIRRPLPGGKSEYWRLSDLELI